MNIGKACAIFKQIDSDKFSDDEKIEAIFNVMDMPTHMGITKDDMINVINFVTFKLTTYAVEINDTCIS